MLKLVGQLVTEVMIMMAMIIMKNLYLFSLVARGTLKLVTQRQKVNWYWIWKFTCILYPLVLSS